MAVAVQGPREKKDPLTTIMQGLSIARDVYGIKANMDASDRAERDQGLADAQRADAAKRQEFADRGGITKQQQIELAGKGFDFSPTQKEGAIPGFIIGQGGKEDPTFLSKAAPKTETMTAYQKASLEAQNRREALASTKDERQAKKLVEEGARKLADAVDKTGISDVLTTLKKLDAKIGGLDSDSDIPGVGPSDSRFDWSDDGKEVRQLASGLKNVILKARSGGAVTPDEADRLLAEIEGGLFKTDADFRRGLVNLRDTMRAKLALQEAGAPEESLALYRGRKGSIHSDDPIFGVANAPGGDDVLSAIEQEIQQRQTGATAGR